MPQDILDHAETTVESLKEYCRQRGPTYGERPFLPVLRTKLMASIADVQTVRSLRMTTLAATAMVERPAGQARLDKFQAAVYHPSSVPPDGPPAAVVVGSTSLARRPPTTEGRDQPQVETSLRTRGLQVAPQLPHRSAALLHTLFLCWGLLTRASCAHPLHSHHRARQSGTLTLEQVTGLPHVSRSSFISSNAWERGRRRPATFKQVS